MIGKHYSVRRRLLFSTMACMALILVVIGIAAHQVARHESEEIFSARLATSARVLESLMARQLEHATIARPVVIPLPLELEHATDHLPAQVGHPYETKIAFQIWNEQGELLAKSASAPDAALSPLKEGFSNNHISGEKWEVFTLKSGGIWVIAAEKDEVRQEMITELGASVLAPLVIGGLLMLLTVSLVLNANLGSLRALAEGIARREPESLAQIELSNIPEELEPVVDELNSLLRRVQAAFEREQRFIDAAAHELRTPIAAVQLHVQNAMRAGTAQERDASLAEAVAGLHRTTRLAGQLLAFSRLAAKTDVNLMQPVSLNQVCRDVIGLQEALLEQRGQTIGLDAAQECVVTGDPYKLQQLLQNLIDNASQYGLPDGEIEVALTMRDGGAMLQVANDGEPVPVEDTEKIFTPYYRVAGRRSPGSGLGLSIVREIAGLHKARITVGRKPDKQGCVVNVAFPPPRA